MKKISYTLSIRGILTIRAFFSDPKKVTMGTQVTVVGEIDQCTCDSKLGHTQYCARMLREIHLPDGDQFMVSSLHLVYLHE